MSEVLLPPWIIPEKEEHEWLDEGSSVFASAFAPGLAQRQSYGGMRLRLKRRHTVRGEEKAVLLSVLKQTRGRFNALRTKVHFERRGSGFGTELQTDTDFSGWISNISAHSTVVAADRVLRILRVSNDGTSPIIISPAMTGVQYAPYVGRVFVRAGRGPILWDARIRDVSDGSIYATTSTNLTSDGYQAFAGVPYDTDLYLGVLDRSTGKVAGDYMDVWYASMARCALVDNGLNMLLQSDEFDSTWTATRASVDDQTADTVAPDGTLTADSIIEDSTASSSHFVFQSVTVPSTALDYSFGVALKAGARTWAQVLLSDTVDNVSAYFNLSTGAVGTSNAFGNFSNLRTFVVPLGNDWYACYIVFRKGSSQTTLNVRIGLASGNNMASYDGDGSSNIYAWRATLAQSSVPVRLVQTTTAASTGTSQTGNALYVKGLPASTNGLLLPGDWFEINGELKQATAALNSNAAGLGYLQFEPALVRSPANDDPVIVNDPMGKFLVSNIRIENEFGTQAVVTYDLEHIYE